jgi:hypothetical protein
MPPNWTIDHTESLATVIVDVSLVGEAVAWLAKQKA